MTSMKNIVLILYLMVFTTALYSQKEKGKKVEVAIETLRKAMLDGDSLTLLRMTDPALSYGHSKGKIENQQVFVSNLASGRYL